MVTMNSDQSNAAQFRNRIIFGASIVVIVAVLLAGYLMKQAFTTSPEPVSEDKKVAQRFSTAKHSLESGEANSTKQNSSRAAAQVSPLETSDVAVEKKENGAGDLLREGKKSLDSGEFDVARQIFQKIVQKYPGTKAARQVPELDLQLKARQAAHRNETADGLLLKANTFLESGEFDRARQIIQSVSREYPNTKAAEQIPQFEKRIAEGEVAVREAASADQLLEGKEAFDSGNWAEARQHFGAILNRFPDTKAATEAEELKSATTEKESEELLAKAKQLVKSDRTDELEQAQTLLARIVRGFPMSEAAEKVPELTKQVEKQRAVVRQEKAADMLGEGKSAMDAKNWTEAMQHFGTILDEYAGTKAAQEADQLQKLAANQRADTELVSAEGFHKSGHLTKARQSFARIANDFPNTKAGQRAKQLERQVLDEIIARTEKDAEQLLHDAEAYIDQGEWIKARSMLGRLLKEYPSTNAAGEGRNLTKQVKAKRVEEQLATAQKHLGDGDWIAARRELNRVSGESLDSRSAAKVRDLSNRIAALEGEQKRRVRAGANKRAEALRQRREESARAAREKEAAEEAKRQMELKAQRRQQELDAQRRQETADAKRREEAEMRSRAAANQQKRLADQAQSQAIKEKRAAERLGRAKRLMNDGQQDRARELFADIVRNFRGTESAREAQSLMIKSRSKEQDQKQRAAAEQKEKSAALELAEARKLGAEGQMGQAGKKLAEIIRKYPGTKAADEAAAMKREYDQAENEKMAEELLRVAKASHKSGDLEKTRQHIEQIRRQFPGTMAYKQAAELERQINDSLARVKEDKANEEFKKANKSFASGDLEEARQKSEAIIAKFSGTKAADQARNLQKQITKGEVALKQSAAEKQLRMAQESLAAGKWEMARQRIGVLAEKYAGTSAANEARGLLAQVNEKEADELLTKAQTAFESGNMAGALDLLQPVIKNFRGTKAAEKARSLETKAKEKLAEEGLREGKELWFSDVAKAKRLLNEVVKRFPNTEAAKEAEQMLKKN